LALCKVQILIAPTCLKILEEPEFIGFWSSERTAYADRKLIVIGMALPLKPADSCPYICRDERANPNSS
jgi:hypothetical protein